MLLFVSDLPKRRRRALRFDFRLRDQKLKRMNTKEIFEKYKFSFGDDEMLHSCLIPKDVASCPMCGGQLEAEFSAWEKSNESETDVFFPSEGETSIFCIRKQSCNNKDSIENRMPYVYWLPRRTAAEAWVLQVLRRHFNPPPPTLEELEQAGQKTLFETGKKFV